MGRMENKYKIYWIALGMVIVVTFLLIGESENFWIKDARGVWIKHGTPLGNPSYVSEQQKVIEDALKLCETKIREGIDFHMFDSDRQYLGNSSDGKYGIFVVWTPENGTVDMQRYSNLDSTGKMKQFILLDRDGNVAKVS